MPGCDYRCTACGHQVEVFQNMSDNPVSQCLLCDVSVIRLINGGQGLIFKESGFYITGYKKKPDNSSEV